MTYEVDALNKNHLMNLKESNLLPKSIGIILDGNGRWAIKRGLSRNEGHKAGVQTLLEVIDETLELQIPCLYVFAFSQENWKRPKVEVDFLMMLCEKTLNDYLDKAIQKGICIKVLGSRVGLSNNLISLIDKVENMTFQNKLLTLNICFNYGSRQELVSACKMIAKDVQENKYSVNDITEETIQNHLYQNSYTNIDFLIRTSGEFRISNFLLWQISYSELYFTNTLWPDFHKEAYRESLEQYTLRKRRFGGL